MQSDIAPLIETNDYADNVMAQQISQIAGVSQVFIGGEQKRAIRVQVDEEDLFDLVDLAGDQLHR